MAGALLGSLSCARCAEILPSGDGFCTRCGARQLPAAVGGALAQTGGLLAGLVQAAPARRRGADGIDVAAAVVAAAAAATASAPTGHVVLSIVSALAGAVIVIAVQLVALTLSGRTLGLALLGLRRVDNLTALPSTVPGAIAGAIVTWRPRSILTADLRQGRDPLVPAPALAALAELDVASGASPSPSERPGGRRALAAGPGGGPQTSWSNDGASPPDSPRRSRHGVRAAAPRELVAESVRLRFDSGDEVELRGALLVGRNPETDGRGTAVHALPDLSRSLSRTHVMLDWRDGLLWVTDLNTTNGSALVDVDGGYRPLVPGLKSAASVGWRVEIGRRTIEILPGEPARNGVTS